jgi:hypothetical protein
MGRLSTSVFSPWSSDPAHGRFAALHSGTTIPYRASPRVLSELHSMVLDSILPRPRARVPCSEKKIFVVSDRGAVEEKKSPLQRCDCVFGEFVDCVRRGLSIAFVLLQVLSPSVVQSFLALPAAQDEVVASLSSTPEPSRSKSGEPPVRGELLSPEIAAATLRSLLPRRRSSSKTGEPQRRWERRETPTRGG